MIRVIIIVVLLSGAAEAWSQSGAGRQALRALEKEKWQKSRTILQKALRKDSTTSAAHYAFARYYFTPSNPSFNIDSAYSAVNQALANSGGNDMKKRAKDQPDTVAILRLRQRIDSAGFIRATREHSESAYNFFITHFVHAAQLDTARLLRDEVAWQDVATEHSPEAFAGYFERYPASRYADKARARYQELLFRINTKDQRLNSFESFLTEYPESPYRHLVEEQILEIYTADGAADKFSEFLRRFPESPAGGKARDILYHILREGEHGMKPFAFWNDSLMNIERLNERFLVPFIDDGKFGFMDSSGNEIIAATSTSLYEGYRCGDIHEDILVCDGGIMSRDGTVIFKGRPIELSDLGYGFIGIETSDCYHIVHKTGFAVGKDCSSDAMIIAGRFIAIQKDSKWNLYSLTGRPLTDGWEEVRSLDDVIALRRGGKWALVTARQIGMVADQQPLQPAFHVDDVRSWSRGLIWVRNGNTEAVLDTDLNMRIPFGEYELRQESFGVLAQSPVCLRIFGRQFEESVCIDDVKFNSSWVGVKQKDKWSLYDPENGNAMGAYDTITFTGVFAAVHHGNSVGVYFRDSISLAFPGGTNLAFIAGRDGRAFLQVERAGRKTVYDADATKLFDGYYDRIQHAGGNYFIVSRNEKKGLITSDGKQVLPFAYDAIGEMEGTRIPLLTNMRFGLYDAAAKKEVRPAYDKNIVRYNEELFIAFRRGKSGMVDINSRIRVPFQYDAFRYWNDTSALARQDNLWKIIDIRTNEAITGDFHEYNVVSDADGELVVIVRRGSEFGVLSNTKGEVIPPTYTDVVNIGSASEPLYLTEKHVREAALSVVIYYDATGRPVRHQAMEPGDFDMIYCDDK